MKVEILNANASTPYFLFFNCGEDPNEASAVSRGCQYFYYFAVITVTVKRDDFAMNLGPKRVSSLYKYLSGHPISH